MNHSNHPYPHETDARLAHLDPERLTMLLNFAKELADAPQNQKMNTFFSVHKKATQNQISFTKNERELLLQVLTEHMSEEEKKRVELIQNLAAKLNSGTI